MREFDPEVLDVVWAACEPLLAVPVENHPWLSPSEMLEPWLLRSHPGPVGHGFSWEDAERLCAKKVPDMTARARRDEWIAKEVFDELSAEEKGLLQEI